MSQYDFGNLESPVSGTALINTHLEPWRNALHTMHSGTTRPAYAQAGTMWLNTTSTPWVVNVFDGAQDIQIGTINASTDKFRPNIDAPVTATALITTLASATGGAGFNLPHGAAPTSPVNGDLWTTTAGVYARVNGVTRNLIDSMEFLGSFSVTNAATLPITGVMSSTYDEYYIHLQNIRAITDSVSLNAQVSTNNGSTWETTTAYSHARNTTLEVATNNPAGGGGATSIILVPSLGNAANEAFYLGVDIWGANEAAYTNILSRFSGANATPNYANGYGGGVHVSTATVNAVRFLMSGGNITGTALVYGRRKTA